MKKLSALLCVTLVLALAGQAEAAKKKKKAHHRQPSPLGDTSQPAQESASSGNEEAETGKEGGKSGKDALNFDFFGDPKGAGNKPAGVANLDETEVADKAGTRRWMLKTHQTLGIATWVLMAGTVLVGQLNYNQLYGGGGGSTKWQTPHRILVVSTSLSFATTAGFSLFAPNPYPKPLRFDTGLVHRIAVIGATLGMLTGGVLGWITARQADAGNPNNLRSHARIHQIVGYTTFGFLTVAGTVWVF